MTHRLVDEKKLVRLFLKNMFILIYSKVKGGGHLESALYIYCLRTASTLIANLNRLECLLEVIDAFILSLLSYDNWEWHVYLQRARA